MTHALIIEDELLLALSVEDALRQLGYLTFEITASKSQAIASTERQCPDLIVADHRITDSTGTEAVQAICSERAIPVVFVTGSEAEDRAHLPEALIVAKPLTHSRLESAVRSAIARPFRHIGGN